MATVISDESELIGNQSAKFTKSIRDMSLETFRDKLIYLFNLGHFGSSSFEEIEQKVLDVRSDDFKNAVKSLRQYSSLDGDLDNPEFDLDLVDAQSMRQCGCPDILQSAENPRLRGWKQKEITLWHGLSREGRTQMPGRTHIEITRLVNESLELINQWSGLKIRQVQDGRPDIYCLAVFLDGGGSVLADMVLPNPEQNNAATAGDRSRQLRGRFDTGDARSYANDDFFKKVFIHEVGHALGLGHSNSRSDIMFPSILNTELNPGPGDLNELHARYGQPTPKTDPEPDEPKDPSDPKPPVNKYPDEVTVTMGGKSFAVPAREV